MIKTIINFKNMETKHGVWLSGVLGLIITILLCILFFVPVKKISQPVIAAGIEVISPKTSAEVSSPIKITGVVNGDGWSGFEGQVGTVRLLDNQNKELATGVLTTTTEWTTLPTNFETTLVFSSQYKGTATLSFHNENPSGMPDKDKYFILPIIIK